MLELLHNLFGLAGSGALLSVVSRKYNLWSFIFRLSSFSQLFLTIILNFLMRYAKIWSIKPYLYKQTEIIMKYARMQLFRLCPIMVCDGNIWQILILNEFNRVVYFEIYIGSYPTRITVPKRKWKQWNFRIDQTDNLVYIILES